MDFDETVTKKRSLGALRKTPKTKDRSPDSTGILKLERHTFDAIAKQFRETDADTIDCCIAGWRNTDSKGERYVTVEISPKYVARRHEPAQSSDLADFI